MAKKTKVHRVVLLIVDHDDIGADQVHDELVNNTRYANDCIFPTVLNIETREVEWNDGHPLNKRDTIEAATEKLFGGE